MILIIFYFTSRDLTTIPQKIADDFLVDTLIAFITVFTFSMVFKYLSNTLAFYTNKEISDLKLVIHRNKNDINTYNQKEIDNHFLKIYLMIIASLLETCRNNPNVQNIIRNRFQINSMLFMKGKFKNREHYIIVSVINTLTNITLSEKVYILQKRENEKFIQLNPANRLNLPDEVLFKTLKNKANKYNSNIKRYYLINFELDNQHDYIAVCQRSFSQNDFEDVDELIVEFFLKHFTEYSMKISNNNIQPIISNSTLEYQVESVRMYIKTNFRDEIDRNILAQSVNMHPDSLGKAFKKYSGNSLKDFINQCRINYAKELLCNSENSIIRIAFSSGFQSLATFNRIFKKQTGKSPSEFKSSHTSQQ